MLSLYSHYKCGHLLRSGGIAEQPALYVDAMQFIGARVAEAEKELMEKRDG